MYGPLSLLVLVLLRLYCLNASKNEIVKKSDPNDNRGNTPFFLQDPHDSTCLSPTGFTICDENALWILTKRAGRTSFSLVSLLHPQTQACLQRKPILLGFLNSDKVVAGSCGKSSSKSWMFEFVDQTHVKLSNDGQCLVRGKTTYKNSISVQNCNKGEFVPLVYHPTAVHENGFLLKAADGTCFDGTKFKNCQSKDLTTNLWGIGVRYLWNGDSSRYFFNIQGDRETCLISKGLKVERGLCSDTGALNWGLHNGQLTAHNGKHCLARLADDSAILAKCSDAYEFIAMEIPPTQSSSEQMLHTTAGRSKSSVGGNEGKASISDKTNSQRSNRKSVK